MGIAPSRRTGCCRRRNGTRACGIAPTARRTRSRTTSRPRTGRAYPIPRAAEQAPRTERGGRPQQSPRTLSDPSYSFLYGPFLSAPPLAATPCSKGRPPPYSSSVTRPPSYRQSGVRAAEQATSATLGLHAPAETVRHWGATPWCDLGPFSVRAVSPPRRPATSATARSRRAQSPPHRTYPATPLGRMDDSAPERPLPVSPRPASVQNPVPQPVTASTYRMFNRYELEHPCRSGGIRTTDTGNEAELASSGFSPFRQS